MAVQTWPKAGRHTVRPYSDRTFLQSPHDAYGLFYLVYHQAQPQDAGLHPRLLRLEAAPQAAYDGPAQLYESPEMTDGRHRFF